MGNWVQQAIAQWNEEGLELNLGATMVDIERVEEQIHFKFPQDFKELYSTVNGFVDFEWKNNMVSLWSLDRIIDDYKEGNKLIMFGDFCISVCQYGFHKNQAGIYKAYSHFQHGPGEFITESCQKVIELINQDSIVLF